MGFPTLVTRIRKNGVKTERTGLTLHCAATQLSPLNSHVIISLFLGVSPLSRPDRKDGRRIVQPHDLLRMRRGILLALHEGNIR